MGKTREFRMINRRMHMIVVANTQRLIGCRHDQSQQPMQLKKDIGGQGGKMTLRKKTKRCFLREIIRHSNIITN